MAAIQSKISPVQALLIGAFVISFSSVLVKISHVPATVSAFYRVFFGSIFLLIACLVKKEFKTRGLKKQSLGMLCGLFFALDLWAWHWSIQYVGPGLATVLGNFQVFVLTIVGYFAFKESVGIKFILSLPLAFLGLFLIIGVDIDILSREYIAGIVFGLATAGFYSMFLLLLRQLQSDKNDFSLFYYLMQLSVVCACFLGLKIYFSPDSFAIPDLSSFVSLFSLGFFNQFLAWVMISNALPKVKASHAGLILLLQPSLSFVWDVLFFDRPTGMAGWIGLAIVLSAIYLGMTQKEKILPETPQKSPDRC